MNNTHKYILLYTIFILSIAGSYFIIESRYEDNIKIQKNILIQQAQIHFNNQINTRKWNAMYGGLYAKPQKGQEPNKYLKNPILKVDENLTLIKINPAWMTRQLSELSDLKDFSFRITSLNPINPNNKPNKFETRALKNFERTYNKEYYEFDDKNEFRYMGALITTKACLQCHQHQNYKVGDIRGGISISLDSTKYFDIIESMKSKRDLSIIFVFLFLSIITYFIHTQLNANKKLKENIDLRTKEIDSTKKLLQSILDADKSFLLVSDGEEIIYANKTVLDFAGFSSMDDFLDHKKHISDKFEKVDDEEFLQAMNNGMHWIEYVIKEQDNKDLKVLVKDDGVRYFKPHTKKIKFDEKDLHIITFDDITSSYTTIQELETQAVTDQLTNLFNRRKLDNVLKKEMELSSSTNLPLSIIFLDIDHFKKVNDTLGHDVGDTVLIELANIITSTIRQGDFVARWGGEEFMIALQATDINFATKLAEKIRHSVEKHKFKEAGHVTISLGVTEYLDKESEDDFTKRVDDALYEAKNTGRNRVVAN